MKSLVVMAMVGVCSAIIHQNFNPVPHSHTSQTHQKQPKYTGPVASSIPAGIDGKVIPVENTEEVAAAMKAFVAAYQRQLDNIAEIRQYADDRYYPDSQNLGTHHTAGVTYRSDDAYYSRDAYNAEDTQQPAYQDDFNDVYIPVTRNGFGHQAAGRQQISHHDTDYNPLDHQSFAQQAAGHTTATYTLAAPKNNGYHSALQNPAARHSSGKQAAGYSSAGTHHSEETSTNVNGFHGILRDTPEVAAEKARFFSLYSRMAAEAEEAPDDYTDY